MLCTQQDGGGLFTETRVIINIYEVMSLNFEYDRYEASIPENQVSLYLSVAYYHGPPLLFETPVFS